MRECGPHKFIYFIFIMTSLVHCILISRAMSVVKAMSMNEEDEPVVLIVI